MNHLTGLFNVDLCLCQWDGQMVWERGCITCNKLLLKMSIHLNKLKKTWNSVKWNPPSLLCPPVAQTDKGKLRIDVEFCLTMKMLIQKGIKMYIIQANLGCLKLCPDLYSLTLTELTFSVFFFFQNESFWNCK